MTADTLLMFEFALPALLAVVLLTGCALPRPLAKFLLCAVCVTHAFLTALRPEDYNSDTAAYVGYVDVISTSLGGEILVATKLEPLHLLLAWMFDTFREWAAAEAAIAAALVIYICARAKRLETLAVILGSSMPLLSSSVRFAVAVLAVSATLLACGQTRLRFWLVSAVGGITHVSLAVAGLFDRRKTRYILAILVAFLFLSQINSALEQRSGADKQDDAVVGSGLRSMFTLLMYVGYLFAARLLSQKQLLLDLVSACAVFVLVFFFYPVLNRWIILLLLVYAIRADAELPAALPGRVVEALVAAALFVSLVLPQLITVQKAVPTGEW